MTKGAAGMEEKIREGRKGRDERRRELKKREERMLFLRTHARVRSWVKQREEFAIDEVNVYRRLGHDTFVQLATNFYDSVYADDSTWFKSIFAYLPKEDAIQNQYEFLIERMGGPALYTWRKGHPADDGRQWTPFLVNVRAAERWLQHMKEALDSVGTIDADSKIRMWDFFRTWCTESLQCRNEFEFSFPYHAAALQVKICEQGARILRSMPTFGKKDRESLLATFDRLWDVVKDSPGGPEWAVTQITKVLNSMKEVEALLKESDLAEENHIHH